MLLVQPLYPIGSRRQARILEHLTAIPLGFVQALGEQSDASSVRRCAGDLGYGQATLLQGEVGLGAAVELAATLTAKAVGIPGKARQLVAPVAADLSASVRKGKLLETGDSRLIEVPSWHPHCVEFGVGQLTPPRHPRHISIGVPLVPDRIERSGKDKVAGVASAWREPVSDNVPRIRSGPGFPG